MLFRERILSSSLWCLCAVLQHPGLLPTPSSRWPRPLRETASLRPRSRSGESASEDLESSAWFYSFFRSCGTSPKLRVLSSCAELCHLKVRVLLGKTQQLFPPSSVSAGFPGSALARGAVTAWLVSGVLLQAFGVLCCCGVRFSVELPDPAVLLSWRLACCCRLSRRFADSCLLAVSSCCPEVCVVCPHRGFTRTLVTLVWGTLTSVQCLALP